MAELEEDVTDCTGNCSYTWTSGDSLEPGKYTLKIAVSAKGYKSNVKESSIHIPVTQEHRQFLNDKIAEYYKKEKGSERYGAPFT